MCIYFFKPYLDAQPGYLLNLAPHQHNTPTQRTNIRREGSVHPRELYDHSTNPDAGNRNRPTNSDDGHWLKQTTKLSRRPIHDDQLTRHVGAALSLVGRGVPDIQRFEVEAFENTPDVRVVVDADHHPALAAPHEHGHLLVVLEGEVDTVTCRLPVRRVHVVKRVRSIVAFSAFQPG